MDSLENQIQTFQTRVTCTCVYRPACNIQLKTATRDERDKTTEYVPALIACSLEKAM